MTDSRVAALCDEFEVRIVPKSAYPGPGETRAVATLEKIIRRHGIEHARLVMTTLVEAGNHKILLDNPGLGATSDIIRACGRYIELDPSAWLECWDHIPGGQLEALCLDLRGFVPMRGALAGMLYERVARRFLPRFEQLDMFDDRRAKR